MSVTVPAGFVAAGLACGIKASGAPDLALLPIIKALLAAGFEKEARAVAHDAATGRVYQVFRTQAAVLGYADVFFYSAIVAFIVVPFCFLLSPKTGGMQAGGGH